LGQSNGNTVYVSFSLSTPVSLTLWFCRWLHGWQYFSVQKNYQKGLLHQDMVAHPQPQYYKVCHGRREVLHQQVAAIKMKIN